MWFSKIALERRGCRDPILSGSLRGHTLGDRIAAVANMGCFRSIRVTRQSCLWTGCALAAERSSDKLQLPGRSLHSDACPAMIAEVCLVAAVSAYLSAAGWANRGTFWETALVGAKIVVSAARTCELVLL